ncbi:twitching motility protein PilT [[Phormidium ambiguum] IAM M-71]|uniref:Twitching motility protein PilT n=1 Tax=[Phormidium ambiguum] IAM M-71 TaxID=454136 RepID=A0A1U7IQL3_9CYAN|nr:type II toxin-antitoxin system VapC family toxin [Phormidium ambiguum]OKH39658.1 twitching motility protein PilT [Phormidium ambiguum IAM M-71]
MNLLLDTHVFIWLSLTPERLSERVTDLLMDETNLWFLSLVSIWEMQIKRQLGKLSLNLPLPELIASQQQTNGLQLLPIELNHIFTLENLPQFHRDPFDRLLIAQAITEQIPLLSIDTVFDHYPVQRLW